MGAAEKTLGAWGEEQAARYLRRRGWRIVERNYTVRQGEIDLIALKRGVLAFVEVKLRKGDTFAAPREFVTAAKQQRVLTAASLYLAAHESDAQPRFDVIEVYAPAGEKTVFPKIVHIENAFM